MKIIFMGTPDFSIPSLNTVLSLPHELVSVVTRPDRKVGRKRILTAPPVKKWALEHGVNVIQPENLKEPSFLNKLKLLKPDLLVVVAFVLLPKEVLEIPKWGAINLHASLLPKYRGAAPIHWAIANGEKETGITIFKLDEKMDTGNIIIQKPYKIQENEQANTVSDNLMHMGAELLATAIEKIDKGNVVLTKQDSSLATPAPKVKKEDGLINWEMPAIQIHNRVRGFIIYPGSFTTLTNNRKLKLIRTEVINKTSNESPGTIINISDKGIDVNTGNGLIRLIDVQPEYKSPMKASEFIRGSDEIRLGYKFG